MPILNPDKYLRTAYVDALRPALTGVNVWAKKIPKDVTPLPKRYVLITSQTKSRTEVSKGCYEWLCSIMVDVFNVNVAGYAKPENNDDYEEIIIDTIESGIVVPFFQVKSYDFIDSIDLDIETPAQSLERRVIVYQHWLCQR